MIDKIGKNIARMQHEKPQTFIIGMFLISLLFVPGILLLLDNVQPSLEKVLPPQVEEVALLQVLRGEFGADMIYILLHTDSDVRDPAHLRYVYALEQKIEQNEFVVSTDSLASQVIRQNSVIPDSLRETQYLLSETADYYTDDSYSWTVLRIRSDTNADAQRINQLVSDLEFDIESLETMNPGMTYQVTGYPAIDRATFSVIISDFAFITAVSMLLIAIVVFFTFKSLVRGMLPMVVVMNALIWTMGIVGYLGLTITVVSMVAAAMIMGLGIDFGIHFVHSYFEQRKESKSKEALEETLSELFRAMLGASLTTSAGFLALLFGVLPAMQTLGIILAIGIISTLLGAAFLLPPIVYLYDIKIMEAKK